MTTISIDIKSDTTGSGKTAIARIIAEALIQHFGNKVEVKCLDGDFHLPVDDTERQLGVIYDKLKLITILDMAGYDPEGEQALSHPDFMTYRGPELVRVVQGSMQEGDKCCFGPLTIDENLLK